MGHGSARCHGGLSTGRPCILGKFGVVDRKAKNQARQKIKLLSHAFTKAVEWGESCLNEYKRSTSFNSVWKRFMDRVLKETKVTERFAERDLRAKAASDANDAEGLGARSSSAGQCR